MAGLLIEMGGKFSGVQVGRRRLVENSRYQRIDRVKLQVCFVGQAVIILFFFPERFKKVFLKKPLGLIIKGIRVRRKKKGFVFTFVSHTVKGHAFYLGRI
jgi:hypothetical protein